MGMFGWLSRSCGDSTAEPSFGPPHDFKVRRLVLGRDESVADEKIDEDETAVGLEIARVQSLNRLGQRQQLGWISTGSMGAID